jgi:UDP-N-acetylglucosamine--N-acetylmuramyl-(pentapeptide) pyrophosphoryl-undecaprenol N-acetylglucosamine transferase
LKRVLVASTGGHLYELLRLAPRLRPQSDEELWVTFDSEQSRTWLGERHVRFVRTTKPRDWRGVVINAASAREILTSDVESVVSTGAAVALSFLPLACARGVASHYVESSARVEAPSLTGRALSVMRGVRLYTQHPELANSRWHYAGSVFDSFRPVSATQPRELRRVFITIGTTEFSFVGFVNRIRAILPASVEVVLQAGIDTPVVAWSGAKVSYLMTADAVREAVGAADVVVAHAGIGSALTVLEAGKIPVLVPRMASRGEHVDDHQVQIARHLAERGLAVTADSRTITLDHLLTALQRGVEQTRPEPTFALR